MDIAELVRCAILLVLDKFFFIENHLGMHTVLLSSDFPIISFQTEIRVNMQKPPSRFQSSVN